MGNVVRLPDTTNRRVLGNSLDELIERDPDALRGRSRHRSLDEARADDVRGNAELAQFERQRLREALDAGLGSRVVDLSPVAESRDAGQVDDAAEAGLDH